MTLSVGVPTEIKTDERRVARVPGPHPAQQPRTADQVNHKPDQAGHDDTQHYSDKFTSGLDPESHIPAHQAAS